MSVRDRIRAMPKPARDRLKRHVCWMCEINLDRGWCSAVMVPRCDDRTMLKRAADCLSQGKTIASREAGAVIYREIDPPAPNFPDIEQ